MRTESRPDIDCWTGSGLPRKGGQGLILRQRGSLIGPSASGHDARRAQAREHRRSGFMTGSKRRTARRRGRAALLGAIASSAVMAVAASSANAATAVFSASFDDAALNLPVLGTSDILNPPPP